MTAKDEMAGERDVLVCLGCRKPKPCSCWMQGARDRMAAGERDVLAEALRAAEVSQGWVPSQEGFAAERVLTALAARGYTLSRSEPDGLPPGMRLVSGPVGTCEWTAHHWTADRWGQTICLACNARIEPIPAAPSPEPLPLDVADHYRELARALNAESIPRGTSVQAYRKQVVARLYEILDAAALREPDRPTPP